MNNCYQRFNFKNEFKLIILHLEKLIHSGMYISCCFGWCTAADTAEYPCLAEAREEAIEIVQEEGEIMFVPRYDSL